MMQQEVATNYIVLINDEEQYSIWSSDKPIPHGWAKEGFHGDKAACVAYIDKTWTDMRPKSLREEMDAAT